MLVHEPDTFFWGTDKEIREKQNFFVNRSVPKYFQWENFWGIHSENPYHFKNRRFLGPKCKVDLTPRPNQKEGPDNISIYFMWLTHPSGIGTIRSSMITLEATMPPVLLGNILITLSCDLMKNAM